MPVILDRCPTCGRRATGLYVRAQFPKTDATRGVARVWARIAEATYCKTCRIVVPEKGAV